MGCEPKTIQWAAEAPEDDSLGFVGGINDRADNRPDDHPVDHLLGVGAMFKCPGPGGVPPAGRLGLASLVRPLKLDRHLNRPVDTVPHYVTKSSTNSLRRRFPGVAVS
jgi:hypothetical protein